MKEIDFIDGKSKVTIRNDHLASYLEKVEAAGYLVKANKCKSRKWQKDVLMIGKPRDFEEFFSGKARIKEIIKQFTQVYRLLFNDREIIIYLLQRDFEITDL